MIMREKVLGWLEKLPLKIRKNGILSRILIFCVCLAVLGIVSLAAVNFWVVGSTSDQILSTEDAANLSDADCILVLGCYVWEDGTPSDMLEDRLRRGVELYRQKAAPKLLMSGDHGTKGYNEVKAMRGYAMDAGIDSRDIFMDHAGFSTYESIYRARDVFQADKIIVVSQGYHLYRALYIANALGVEAYGVSADYRNYVGQTGRDIREVLARVKDFAMCIFQPAPTFLGEALPVSGDGNITNDETQTVPEETTSGTVLADGCKTCENMT